MRITRQRGRGLPAALTPDPGGFASPLWGSPDRLARAWGKSPVIGGEDIRGSYASEPGCHEV